MKKIFIISVVLILYSCGTKKSSISEINNSKPITLYYSTKDYNVKHKMQINANIIIKDKSKQHLRIKKIINPNTGLKLKKAATAWAIQFQGDNYFNLSYSLDVYQPKSYAKFDIEGRFCAIIIDDNSPNILKTNSTYYGGGLTGVLIGESAKWNKNWKDKNGNKKRILFIDTWKESSQATNRDGNSLGNYLTRKQLKDIINSNGIKVNTNKMKDISFEKVIEIIKMLNAKK